MKKLFFASIATVIAGFTLLAAAPAQAEPLVPPYKVKWSQSPDMDLGTDHLSMHRTGGPVVADDFRSNGKPIVGFHWWGSYFDYDPLLPPGTDRQVSFEISFHTNCEGGSTATGCDLSLDFSHPNTTYQHQIIDAEESFFDTAAGGERVYEYWALLDTPWEEIADEIYWVDIAWAAGQLGTPLNANVWGWHESPDHWKDAAVQTGAGAVNPHLGPWNKLTAFDKPIDMAFEVLTVPEPGTLALFGIGLVALGLMRRGKTA